MHKKNEMNSTVSLIKHILPKKHYLEIELLLLELASSKRKEALNKQDENDEKPPIPQNQPGLEDEAVFRELWRQILEAERALGLDYTRREQPFPEAEDLGLEEDELGKMVGMDKEEGGLLGWRSESSDDGAYRTEPSSHRACSGEALQCDEEFYISAHSLFFGVDCQTHDFEEQMNTMRRGAILEAMRRCVPTHCNVPVFRRIISGPSWRCFEDWREGGSFFTSTRALYTFVCTTG